MTESGGSSLEARVRCLEAQAEILQLKRTYCRYCDMGYDGKLIASLYTEDGVLENSAGTRAEGREEIERMFEGMSDVYPFAAHLVTNPLISVKGDTATGEWWLIMPCTRVIEGSPTAAWVIGVYHDAYRRVDGEWKIRHSFMEHRLYAQQLEDWGPSSVGSSS